MFNQPECARPPFVQRIPREPDASGKNQQTHLYRLFLATWAKAYLMREDFNRFWTHTSPTWASKFLQDWCVRTSGSKIEPMQNLVKTLLRHEPLLLNWFES